MMRNVLLGAAMSALLVAPASAAVIVDNSGATQGMATAAGDGTSSLDVTFSWSDAPVTQFIEFTTDETFDILFASFATNGSTSDVTGLVVDFLDPVNGDTRLTTETSACGDAAGDVAGQCNFIAPAQGTSGNAAGATKPGTTVFSNLASGSYRIGLFDSATPTIGTALFTISESAVAVPAPGALGLLGLGLLGLGLRRRTR
ncbi:MAG: PEP-CTERM sorting domain-containing protein [Pacificimonas sp.]